MRSDSTSSTRTFMTPTAVSEAAESTRQPKRALKRNTQVIIIGGLLIVSLFLFWQYREARQKLNAATPAAANQQVSDVISKVSKLIIVPAAEKPTVATVVDASKLKSQSFFANAKNGDKVLVYSKEKEAILYRPSSNQIVIVSPVNVNSSTGLAGQ